MKKPENTTTTKSHDPQTTMISASAAAHEKPTKEPKKPKVEATVQELLRVKGVLEGALMDASKRGAAGEMDLLKRFHIVTLRRLKPYAKTTVVYEEK